MFVGWAIDLDYILEGDRVGYGQCEPEYVRTIDNYNCRRHAIVIATDLTASEVAEPVRFRLLDGDGNVYYGGSISRAWLNGDEPKAFAALEFAEADAGATELQFRYGSDQNWQTL
jgi:hypothetical protein